MAILAADDRIITALDVDSFDEMRMMVDCLGDSMSYYKVGMELFYREGPVTVEYLKKQQKLVFLDLKLHDIPHTVAQGIAALTRLGVNLMTIHSTGGRAMMTAAVDSARETAAALGIERPRILAVTALTSFDDQGWQEIGGALPISDHVIKLARLAQLAGVDGVVASPREAGLLRGICGKDFLIVTPGIRPAFAQANDQKRIMTPSEALQVGASKLVIGRPILRADDPAEAVQLILSEIQGGIR